MTASDENLEKLPQTTRARLDELTASLAKALGDDLVSVVVHGSAVRGGFRDGLSDVDVVLVLRSVTRESLSKMANPLALARNSARIECMIVESGEIARAADVFPLFYADIQRVHAVLHGKDPFDSLTISPQHLRLRVEQELREAHIRLRRAVTDALGDKDLVVGAVVRKIRQARAPLRALLGLRGKPCDDDLNAVLRACGETYGVDVGVLSKVRESPWEAFTTLAKLLAKAIEDVDALETTDAKA